MLSLRIVLACCGILTANNGILGEIYYLFKPYPPAPAIGAESPEVKTPVYASGQERRRSSLPAVADTAVFAEDLERKARLGAQIIVLMESH
jgi:hypothetical protein